MRSCYTLWEEKVPPVLVIEVVSTTPGGEYTKKLQEYAQMGVLCYVIYSLKKVLHLGNPKTALFATLNVAASQH
jgi:Uma2 family endonuclease